MKTTAIGFKTWLKLAGGILVYLALVPSALATTYQSTTTGGLWNATGTWTNNALPTASDDVIIATTAGNQVTLNASSSAANVTINAGTTLGLNNDNTTSRTLTIAGNLANNGTITLGTGATTSPTAKLIFSGSGRTWTGSGDISGVKCALQVNTGGSLDISGLTTPLKLRSGSGGQPWTINGALITGAQVIDNNGNTSMTVTFGAGSGLITANPNGIITATGTFGNTFQSSQFTWTTGASVTFNGTSAQVTTGLPITIANLTNNNPAGVTFTAPSTTVTTNLQLNAQPLGFTSVANGLTNLVVNVLNTGGPANTVNIGSLPPPLLVSIGSTYTLISYTTINGSGADFTLGTLPAGYAGHINNNTGNKTIELIIDTVPTAPKSLLWLGSPSGDWDTTTKNWLGGISTNYVSGDLVTFDDTAPGTTTVNLTTNLTPGSLLVSNLTKSYTFSGSGGIGGITGLIKEGANSLTFANSGTNSFTGGIALNAGTLIYNRSDTNTEANVINGAGALVKNGAGMLTLSAGNSYGGGSTVNAGTLRLNTGTSAGSGAVIVNSGATLVVGASGANNITLSNATLAGSVAANVLLSGTITLSSGSTNYVDIYDPTSQNVFANVYFPNGITGSGDINILASTATQTVSINPDNGLGSCRFTNQTPVTYSGTITIGNSVKAEIATAQAGSFSPVNTAKLVLTCGTHGTFTNFIGTWCNLIVRNNSIGDTTIPNNVELAGTGLAVFNPSGTAPGGSKTTMGGLTIGNGQALGVYRNASTDSAMSIIAFPTVTLTGGTATFSPRPLEFGQNFKGSDLSVGNISENSASSIVVNGGRVLSITGTANYSGSTTVSNGTLNLTGSLAGSGAASVAGGTLAGTGSINGAVTIQSGGTLAPGANIFNGSTNITYGVGTLTINNSLTLGGNVLVEVDKSLTPSNDVVTVSGALTYGGTLTATNVGAGTLSIGDKFQIFKAGGAGNFTSILGSPGTGLVWSFSPATGTLCVVASAPPTLGISQVGNVLTFSWSDASFHLQSQTNSLNVGLVTNSASWFNYPDTSNPVNITINPATPTVFFRLVSP